MLELFPLKLPGLLLLAMMVGGMSFFTLVFAPLVFAKLPRPTAGEFLRQVFPIYYRVMAALAILAGAALAPEAAAAALAALALSFLALDMLLIPRIERYREARQADDPAAIAAFGRLHGLSVLVNLAQLSSAIALFLYLAA